MKLGFGYIALRCGCDSHKRWHSFSPISLHSLTFINDQGRTHTTNCYTDFFVATLEEPPSESEGEDGKDLSSDEEQDLRDQFDDPVDDDEEPEEPALDLECGMTDSSNSPVVHRHSKRLQNIPSSESELSSEPVRSKNQKADVS